MMGSVKGVLIVVLCLINTLILIGPLLLMALLKLVSPTRRLRVFFSSGVMWVAEHWAEINKYLFVWLTPTHWDVRGVDRLRRDRSYLVISNHQSWVDIPALLYCFNLKTPYFKFFLKQQLIWIPFLGLAFWALDYPFMKRHSREEVAKNPQLRGQDLMAARAACEKFRDLPVTVVNYLEGTRFTPEKHTRQESPYQHLLRPKAGGVAFALAVLGDQLDAILDVTIVYPGERAPGFWDLLSGRVARIIVDVRTLTPDPALWQGDYAEDVAFQAFVRQWVSDLWTEKDQRITRLQAETKR